MAHFKKVKNKWQVCVKKKGYPRQWKTFFDKATARKWAKNTEVQMDKNVFEDYSVAQGTSLKDLLIKYLVSMIPLIEQGELWLRYFFY